MFVGGDQGDTNTTCCVIPATIKLIVPFQHSQNRLGFLPDNISDSSSIAFKILKNHNILTTAVTSHAVLLTRQSTQAVSHHQQQLIACGVTYGFINGFKIIQINN